MKDSERHQPSQSTGSNSRLFVWLLLLLISSPFAPMIGRAARRGRPLRPEDFILLDFIPYIICVALWLTAIGVYRMGRREGWLQVSSPSEGTNADPETESDGVVSARLISPSKGSKAAGWVLVAFVLLLVAAAQFALPKGARAAGIIAVPPAVFLLLITYLHVAARFPAQWIRRLNEGDGEAVARDLEEEIRQKGATAMRLNNLGVALLNVRRHDEALAAFDEAAEIDPQFPVLACNRALALWRVGRVDEALPLFAAYRRERPAEFVVANNYARLLAELNRMEEAREQYWEAEQLFNAQRRWFPRSQITVMENELSETRTLCGIDEPGTGG